MAALDKATLIDILYGEANALERDLRRKLLHSSSYAPDLYSQCEKIRHGLRNCIETLIRSFPEHRLASGDIDGLCRSVEFVVSSVLAEFDTSIDKPQGRGTHRKTTGPYRTAKALFKSAHRSGVQAVRDVTQPDPFAVDLARSEQPGGPEVRD